jgi:cell division control protein 6
MDDIFEREMQKNTVFLDRNVLSQHYLPETLPHREKEINRIMKTLAPVLGNKISHNIFVYGKCGTGKTSVTKHVIDKLLQAREKYGTSVDCIYINCRNFETKYQVMLKCAEYCYPRENFMGFPVSHLYDTVLKYVRERNTNFVVVLDEIDKVKNLDDLMYTLTRANDELGKGRVVLIGITNNVTFKKELDPRSKSTLCEEEIIFPPYNATQLQAILEQRVGLGFKHDVVEAAAINLTSALVAQESGDARYALRLLLKAGEVADDEKSPKVSEAHVREARRGVEEDIVYEAIDRLPEHQKIVLYAIALLTVEGGRYTRLDGIGEEHVLFSGEVYERYEQICRELGRDARSSRWCREYINELEMMGLITTTMSGKGIRGNTTLIRLGFPAEKVRTVIEKHLKA